MGSYLASGGGKQGHRPTDESGRALTSFMRNRLKNP